MCASNDRNKTHLKSVPPEDRDAWHDNVKIDLRVIITEI
jgi:hypothetical protein